MADVRPTLVDESPMSTFCSEMKAALEQRLAAVGKAGKAAAEREIVEILRRYRGRDAWSAMADAERAAADVSRDTSRDRSGPARARRRAGMVRKGSRRFSEEFDYKLAQSGDRGEE
jgi:hypothetical protein